MSMSAKHFKKTIQCQERDYERHLRQTTAEKSTCEPPASGFVIYPPSAHSRCCFSLPWDLPKIPVSFKRPSTSYANENGNEDLEPLKSVSNQVDFQNSLQRECNLVSKKFAGLLVGKKSY